MEVIKWILIAIISYEVLIGTPYKATKMINDGFPKQPAGFAVGSAIFVTICNIAIIYMLYTR